MFKFLDSLGYVLLGIVVTIVSMLGVALFGVSVADVTVLEFAAVAISYTCTLLFMLQKRIAYPFGILSTALWCALFIAQGFPAMAIFNGVLTVSLIYGWWRWGPDGKTLPVTLVTGWKAWLGYALFFILVAIAFKSLIGEVTNVDVFMASGSALAQLLLDNKKWENWIVWIVVNIVSIVVFWQQGLVLTAVQFALFLLNAMIALYRWYFDLGVKNETSSTSAGNVSPLS